MTVEASRDRRTGGSEKRLRDVQSMLLPSGDRLDRPELLAWVERLALAAPWEEVDAGRV